MVSALFEATKKKHGWTGFVGRCEPGVTKLSALVLPYDPETFSTPAPAAAVTEVPSIPEQLEAFFKALKDGDVIQKKWLEHKAKPSAPVSDDKSNKKLDSENTDDEGNIKKVSLFWVWSNGSGWNTRLKLTAPVANDKSKNISDSDMSNDEEDFKEVSLF